jgi:hypothetical protein
MCAGVGPNLGAVTSGVDVDVRLRAQPPARVLDMAYGTGWSSIAMAQAYPQITVDGLDLDHDAISAARRSVEQAGVADRVRFSVTNAADLGGAGGHDLVTIFEALHDMSQRGGGPPDPHRLLALLPTAPVRPTRVGPGLAKPSPATGLSEIRLLRSRCVRESCTPSGGATMPGRQISSRVSAALTQRTRWRSLLSHKEPHHSAGSRLPQHVPQARVFNLLRKPVAIGAWSTKGRGIQRAC